MTAIDYISPRRVLAIRWGRERAPAAPVEPARPEASAPATMAGMSPRPDGRLDFSERASVAGKASAAARTPEERKERARKAVSVANSPAARARSIAKAWPDMDDDERAEVRAILRRAGVRIS